MKTSELINLLKQYDPNGELNVLINNLTPIRVEYVSDIYNYIQDDKLIFTKNKNTLNIVASNINDFVYDNFNNIYDKIVFNNLSENEINIIKQKINSLVIEAKRFDKEKSKEFINIILNKIDNGYKIIQENDTHDLYFIKSGEKIKLSPEDCRVIIRGSFKPVKYDDHIEWEYDKK